MAHSRHPSGCAAHSLSRSARLVRFIFQNWLPQMGSHHHSRIQNPESYLLDDTAKISPAGIAPAASGL